MFRTYRMVAVAPATGRRLGNDDTDLTSPATGSIQVTVTTTGTQPDPNGYTLSVAGEPGGRSKRTAR